MNTPLTDEQELVVEQARRLVSHVRTGSFVAAGFVCLATAYVAFDFIRSRDIYGAVLMDFDVELPVLTSFFLGIPDAWIYVAAAALIVALSVKEWRWRSAPGVTLIANGAGLTFLMVFWFVYREAMVGPMVNLLRALY